MPRAREPLRETPRKEGASMKEPTKEDVLSYVADVAEQLAAMSTPHDGVVAAILRVAAKAARDSEIE